MHLKVERDILRAQNLLTNLGGMINILEGTLMII
jgi:hypothetical protein